MWVWKYCPLGFPQLIPDTVCSRYADIRFEARKCRTNGPSQPIFDVINAIRDRGQVPHIPSNAYTGRTETGHTH